jgi:GT2 family glycosyltransferase
MSVRGAAGAPVTSRRTASVVVLTHNRRHLLEQCVENVLRRVSPRTKEILIWDNASSDGTAGYLDTLRDRRITVVHHPHNIGVNAYRRAFERVNGDYLIEVDDDVISAPPDWDASLIDAFDRLPDVGYLAANLARNPHDVTSNVMYGINAHMYRTEEVAGIRVKVGGPVGGWCSLLSRDLYDRIGGLPDQRDGYWLEDGVLLEGLARLGYRAACLEDLEVVHASGPYYAATPPAKLAYWKAYHRAAARKDAVKRVLLAVPGVRALNRRHGWFHPPRERPDYVRLYGTLPASEDGAS